MDLFLSAQWLLLAADASLANLWGYSHIVKMALGLGAVIFVHELGHFLAAKACGVKAEKFYVGFDIPMPKIGPFQIPSKFFSFQWGETEYGLGILPLGGYVKMLGQDDNPANAEKEAEKTRVSKSTTDENKAATGVNKAATGGRAEAEENSAAEGSPHPGPLPKGEGEKEDHHKSVTDVDLEPQPLAEDVEFELDPRSYTAKNVPQRMLIISAGVIMNIIFAVIFATIAYRLGVPYTPSVIGGTSPGSPAWKQDIRPGTQILAVGKDAEPKEEMRFLQDMAQAIMLHGYEKDLSLQVRLPGESTQTETITLRPVPKKRDMMFGQPTATIGVHPAGENKLAEKDFVLEGFPAAKAKDGFQGGDEIIAGIVNGEETPFENPWDMEAFMARHVDEPVSLKVRRIDNPDAEESQQTTSTHVVEVAPRKLQRMGLVMTMGPVTAIQQGSPAAKAKFREGDVLVAIGGEKIADPMTFPDDIRRMGTDEIVVTVRRTDDNGEQEKIDITVTPREVREYQTFADDATPVLVDALGLTYAVEPTVVSVDANSPAYGKIKPGDKVTAFTFVAAGADKAQRKKNARKLADKVYGLDEEIELDGERFNWTVPYFAVQMLPPKVEVELKYERDGEASTTRIAPYASDEYHYPTRGVRRQMLTRIHTAESWGEAFGLGLRETKEGLLMVVTFLKKLVSGGISPLSLGGPGMIVAAASSEASVGTSRLLIFLTLLSANLAVVNFLPIPVLDGGHMMFLLYEGIFRKPVNEAWQIRLSLVGFAFLLSLMAFVIGLDIVRFAGGG